MINRPIAVRCLVFAVLVVFGALAAAQRSGRADPSSDYEYRTWTDSTGQYQVQAVMVDFTDEAVRIKKRDGQIVSVPIAKLSKFDQLYIKRKADRMGAASRSKDSSTEPDFEPSPPRIEPGPPRVPPVAQADWPGWRGPNRDGKSPDRGLLKEWPAGGPRLIWQANGIGRGFSSVAVVGGKVYTSGDVGNTLTIFAFDMDGNRLWQTPHDTAWTKSHPGSRSTPMIDNGKLYIVSGNGLVGCYDAERGRKIWAASFSQFGGQTPGWGYSESVLILDNMAIVTPGGQNCIVALDKNSGRPVWTSRGFSAGAQYSSCYAFVHQGVPIVTTGTHGGIVGVDARNGNALWSNSFSEGNTANCPTPAYSDGYVFWANGYSKGGICLQLSGGGGRVTAREAWRTRDMVCHHGGYIIHDGHIYGNHSGGWACLELSSGRKLWEGRGVGKGSLCYADGMLYLFSERGGVAGLATCSPNGMEMRGTFSVQGTEESWAHPVVIGGRLYLRYADNLYCFDVKAT